MRRLTFPLTVLWSSPFCWIPPMYVLTVGCVRCRRFQWLPASHCHIIPAPLTLSILLGFLLTSDRVRVKGIDQKKKSWRNRRSGGSLSRALKLCQSTETYKSEQLMCVLPGVPMANSTGSSLSALCCSGKGVSLGFRCF